MPTINRNPITTQPTARPTDLAGNPLYQWPDGTLHTVSYESQHRNQITVQPTAGTAPPPPPPPPDPWAPSGGVTHGPTHTANPQSPLWWEQAADPWSGGRDTGALAATYNTDFQSERYRQYINSLPGGADSAFARYGQQHFADQMALYMQATEQNPNLTLDQYLSPALTSYLQNQFGLQSTSAQGQQYGPQAWAGRWVG